MDAIAVETSADTLLLSVIEAAIGGHEDGTLDAAVCALIDWIDTVAPQRDNHIAACAVRAWLAVQWRADNGSAAGNAAASARRLLRVVLPSRDNCDCAPAKETSTLAMDYDAASVNAFTHADAVLVLLRREFERGAASDSAVSRGHGTSLVRRLEHHEFVEKQHRQKRDHPGCARTHATPFGKRPPSHSPPPQRLSTAGALLPPSTSQPQTWQICAAYALRWCVLHVKHPLPHLGLILPPLLRLLEMGPTAHAIFALVLPCVHRLLHDIVVEERRRIGLDALFREVLLPRWMAFAQSRYLVGTNGSSCTSAAIDKASLDELHAFLKCLHILVFEIPPQHSQIDDKDVEAVFITYVDAIGALSVDVQRKRDDVNQGAKTGNALDMYLDTLLQVIERAPDSGPDEITMRSIPMSAVLLARHMKYTIDVICNVLTCVFAHTPRTLTLALLLLRSVVSLCTWRSPYYHGKIIAALCRCVDAHKEDGTGRMLVLSDDISAVVAAVRENMYAAGLETEWIADMTLLQSVNRTAWHVLHGN